MTNTHNDTVDPAALSKKEKEVEAQLDRIYKMVAEKKSIAFIKIEYKRAIERIGEKYQILLTMLEMQKKTLGESEFKTQKTALENNYKEDVISLAVAIDEASGIETEATK